jgi:hypothetical protein
MNDEISMNEFHKMINELADHATGHIDCIKPETSLAAFVHIQSLYEELKIHKQLIEQLTDETEIDVMINLIHDAERWRDAMGKVLMMLEKQPTLARNAINETVHVDKY